MEQNKVLSIGVDISKRSLDIAVLFANDQYAAAHFDNQPDGIKQLLSWLAIHNAQGCVLCVEATGGLEAALCYRAYEAKYKVRIVQPSRIYNYRKSLGLRNKTDGADSRLIAHFAHRISWPDWQPSSATVLRLRSLYNHRQLFMRSYVSMIKLCATMVASEQSNAEADIKMFKERIEKIDAQIDELIKQDPELSKTQELLCTIPGVGTQVSAVICIFADHNKFADCKQFAAYSGLTPRRVQSGMHESKTHISRGGCVALRTALYMAALSASRHNSQVRRFAEQLRENRPDLAKAQVITACAHKLARMVYGVLKSEAPFDPSK